MIELLQVAQLDGFESSGRVYSPDGLPPTLNTCGGGNREVKISIPQATRGGYVECEIGGVADLSFPNSETRRGRVQDGGRVYPTVTAESNGLCKIETLFRVRKLTPKECWRLMDFTDDDFDKAKTALNRMFYNGRDKSNSQMYKQAGNSIVVACLRAIVKTMLDKEAV